MKQMIYITGVLLLLLNSCNSGSYTSTLSGGYTYHDAGRNYKDILATKDVIEINDTSLYMYLRKNIYSKVVDYSFNENFIVAVQSPNKQWHKSAIAFELEDIYSNEKSEHLAVEIVNSDPYYQSIFSRKINYWIISHKKDRVYGPLTKREYFQMRKDLGVPEELKLKFMK